MNHPTTRHEEAGVARELDTLPVCRVHGTMVLFEHPATPEQRWCGTWYECRDYRCHNSVLLPSPELLRSYTEMAP